MKLLIYDRRKIKKLKRQFKILYTEQHIIVYYDKFKKSNQYSFAIRVQDENSYISTFDSIIIDKKYIIDNLQQSQIKTDIIKGIRIYDIEIEKEYIHYATKCFIPMKSKKEYMTWKLKI